MKYGTGIKVKYVKSDNRSGVVRQVARDGGRTAARQQSSDNNRALFMEMINRRGKVFNEFKQGLRPLWKETKALAVPRRLTGST